MSKVVKDKGTSLKDLTTKAWQAANPLEKAFNGTIDFLKPDTSVGYLQIVDGRIVAVVNKLEIPPL